MKTGVYKPIVLALLLLLYAGCGVSIGVYHRVKDGETLWRIARTYGMDLQELAEINNIQNPSMIKTDQRIFIPGAREVRETVTYTGNGVSRYRNSGKGTVVTDKERFVWPVDGKVVTPFGMNRGRLHNGIDITSPEGAHVKAAADGRVVVSGEDIWGYGNMVILSHKDGFYTIYAFNSKNLVEKGESVSAGDAIAIIGKTPNHQGYSLHFEVRSGKRLRSPLFFLP